MPGGPDVISPAFGALGVALGLALAAAVPAGWAAARIAKIYCPAPARPTTATMILACLAVFGWGALVTPATGVLPLTLGLGWALVVLAAIDLAALRLPDPITLPLLAAGLVAAAFLPDAPIAEHMAGAAAGYAVLASLAWGFRRLRGADGIGLGDAKLLAAAGGWLGWRPLPSVLVIACAAAFAWIALKAARRGRPALSERIAFGAPLALATWIVWLYGPLAA